MFKQFWGREFHAVMRDDNDEYSYAFPVIQKYWSDVRTKFMYEQSQTCACTLATYRHDTWYNTIATSNILVNYYTNFNLLLPIFYIFIF